MKTRDVHGIDAHDYLVPVRDYAVRAYFARNLADDLARRMTDLEVQSEVHQVSPGPRPSYRVEQLPLGDDAATFMAHIKRELMEQLATAMGVHPGDRTYESLLADVKLNMDLASTSLGMSMAMGEIAREVGMPPIEGDRSLSADDVVGGRFLGEHVRRIEKAFTPNPIYASVRYVEYACAMGARLGCGGGWWTFRVTTS